MKIELLKSTAAGRNNHGQAIYPEGAWTIWKNGNFYGWNWSLAHRSSLGEEMHRFDFNADLREVWLRLAGKFNAGMAELERTPRKGEYEGESPSTGSSFEERE